MAAKCRLFAMSAKKLRVAIVFGGRSGEHEVSLVSAQSIIKALNPKKYDIIPIGITRLGQWLSGPKIFESFKSGQTKKLAAVTLPLNPAKRGFLINNRFVPTDAAFPVLHGPYGEDGTIQGLFEMAGIPYVGCGVFASSACMDKFMSKIIFRAHGLPQVNFLPLTREQIEKELKKTKKLVADNIGFPCFVKPSNMGSSVGISKVKRISELADALALAAAYDSSVIVEKAVENAREIECAVLGNDKPIASVAGEIVPNREFYDYFSKYVDNASKLLIPARLRLSKMREIQKLAVAAYKNTQCSGMARIDFLMDGKTGEIYLNEINTIPGFTSISMYPKLLAASGIPYPKLLDRLLELALERFQKKQKNKIGFESGSDWYK